MDLLRTLFNHGLIFLWDLTSPINTFAIQVYKETYSNNNFSSEMGWAKMAHKSGTVLISHKKPECDTKGILRALDWLGATTLAYVGVSLGVNALWLRKQTGHSSDTAVHSVLSGTCHISLYPALSHGQSSARQQAPFAIKKKTTRSLGFMAVLQRALTSPKGGHKTLRKTECEQ